MNHVLAAIIALILAAPASALAQPPVLDPARTVVVAVDVIVDGKRVDTLPPDMAVTYSASSSEALAMRWCAPGLAAPAACSIVNAKSAFLLTRSAEAYGRILPTAATTGNTIFVNLRKGSVNVAQLTEPFEIAQVAPTPSPTVPPTSTRTAPPEPTPTNTPTQPTYELRIKITQ